MNRKNVVAVIFFVLLGMILTDFSLHLVELLGIKQYHPLYWLFWSSQMVGTTYTVFWTAYWGLAFVLILLLGVLLRKGLGRDKLGVQK